MLIPVAHLWHHPTSLARSHICFHHPAVKTPPCKQHLLLHGEKGREHSWSGQCCWMGTHSFITQHITKSQELSSLCLTSPGAVAGSGQEAIGIGKPPFEMVAPTH